MRDALLFAAVTGVHFLCSVTLLLYVFGAGMARFDSGLPGGPAETVAGWMFAVLSFPVLIVLERLSAAHFPGLWGYIPFAVNASVWGLAAVVACRRLRAKASRPR
jgi:hypothetical protein